jgi:hypothetical protein
LAGFAMLTSVEAYVCTAGACSSIFQHRHVTTQLVFARRQVVFFCFSTLKTHELSPHAWRSS